MKRILAALVVVVTSLGCSRGAPKYPPGHKVGISGLVGPIDIPFGVPPYPQPGITRVAADNNGNLIQSIGGGSYGQIAGAITTDSTLIGNGTGGSPLGVNPTAARSPGWDGYIETYYQQMTGDSPGQFSCYYSQDFGNTSFPINGSTSLGFAPSGTGSSAAFANLPGGVVKCTAATTGAGQCDWNPASTGTKPTTLPNATLSHWATFYKILIGKAPNAASALSFGALFGSTYVGIGYSGAQTLWQYSRGTAPTNIVATTTAINVDSTGATGPYQTLVVGNFDLIHVAGNPDLFGSSGAAPANFELVSNLPSSLGMPYVYNETSSGNGDIYFIDAIKICADH